MNKKSDESDNDTSEFARRIENMRRLAQARQNSNSGEPGHPKIPANILKLPLWPEATRGTPNGFLRGALFAAIQGKERAAFKRELLATQSGVSIRFTGWQLDQSDLDVWEQAAELARFHPLGNVCHFTISSFLKALGRPAGKAQYEWLKNSFARLMAAGLEIKQGSYTYGGSLLEFIYDEATEIYALRLNEKILSLYQAGWTQIDWSIRQKLRRKPLSLWLHGYLSSNAENYATKVETLHKLSGSRAKELKHFKANLKSALADLMKATDGCMGGTLSGDLVVWHKTPTASQMRHLAKRSRSRRKPSE